MSATNDNVPDWIRFLQNTQKLLQHTVLDVLLSFGIKGKVIEQKKTALRVSKTHFINNSIKQRAHIVYFK